MATTAEPDPRLDFILSVLSTADEFKPNWKKANVKMGLSRADVV